MAKKAIKETVTKETVQDETKIFDLTKAGHVKPAMQKLKPYYTKILSGIKNAKFAVVWMSPKTYIESVVGKGVPIREIAYDLETPKTPYPIPYLDLEMGCGVSVELAQRCLTAGYKKIPVMIVAASADKVNSYIKTNKLTEVKL